MTLGLRKHRECALCHKRPAPNAASITGSDDRVLWYCHGDDDPTPTCYMRASWGEGQPYTIEEIIEP